MGDIPLLHKKNIYSIALPPCLLLSAQFKEKRGQGWKHCHMDMAWSVEEGGGGGGSGRLMPMGQGGFGGVALLLLCRTCLLLSLYNNFKGMEEDPYPLLFSYSLTLHENMCAAFSALHETEKTFIHIPLFGLDLTFSHAAHASQRQQLTFLTLTFASLFGTSIKRERGSWGRLSPVFGQAAGLASSLPFTGCRGFW